LWQPADGGIEMWLSVSARRQLCVIGNIMLSISVMKLSNESDLYSMAVLKLMPFGWLNDIQ